MLAEKYRPKSLDEVIGQSEIVTTIKNIVARKELPHMLFVGASGCGKTTVAVCIAHEVFGEDWKDNFKELNASDDRGIDVIRQKIKRLASIRGRRIILLDEADNMTIDAMNALRRIMEKSKGTTLILTCNHEYKIIDPIKSRCVIYRFKKLSDEEVLRRILSICQKENFKIDAEAKKGLIRLVQESKGDLRRAINTLEKLITEKGEITVKDVIMLGGKPEFVKNAVNLAIGGDFEKAKDMLEDAYLNSKFDGDGIVRELYDTIGQIQDREIRIRLYCRLSDTEYRLKIGSDTLIELMGFLSYVWVVPHLRNCPALDRS
ncbi:replication factor C small subunit [Patescibacteria group bacterium]|nr:replication factor C small subunit [Patescibacteria group bacterium]